MDALNDLDKLTTFLVQHDTESSDSDSVSLDEPVETPDAIQKLGKEYTEVGGINVSVNVDETIAAPPQGDGKPAQIDGKVHSHRTTDTSGQSDAKTTSEFHDDDEYTRTVINTCTDPLLKNALMANVKKRRLLETLYARCEAYLRQVAELNVRNRTERIVQHNQRHLGRSRLGMPYFKDRYRFPCPVNKDCLKPSRNDYSDYEPKVSWTTGDKQKMAKAVYEEVRQRKLAQIDKQMLALQKQGEQTATKGQMLALATAQTAFNDFKFVEQLALSWSTNFTDVRDTTDAQQQQQQQEEEQVIVATGSKGGRKSREALENDMQTPKKLKQVILEAVARWTDIDWHRISCDVLHGRHSENECRAKWRCYMNPRFSKHRWTQQENEQLCRLVHRHGHQDWDAIAGELGTTRSAYQCCVHYESTLNTSHKRKPWQGEEDELLVSTVASCAGPHNRIPWSKVALYFTDRTKVQLYNRYRFVADPNLRKGNFSVAEDALLLVLARLHNADFGQMNVYFPGREINQIRARYATMTTRVNLLDWTVAEDAALIEHVSRYGEKHWSRLALQRNQHSCRHRYNVLRRWLDAHPDSRLEDVVRRRKNKRRLGRDRRQHVLDGIVDQVLERLAQMTDRQERDRFLSLGTMQHYLKLVPDYKHLERKGPSVRPKRRACVVNQLLRDFFQCTYRHRGRAKVIRPDETVAESADTIAVMLRLLRANLQLPTETEIDSHPKLDAVDKAILRQLLTEEQANVTEVDSEVVPGGEEEPDTRTPTVIPPNPETLIGWRGLLLLYPTLVKHSKRQYTAPTVDINTELKKLYTKVPIAKARAAMNRYLEDSGIDEQTRDTITTERLLFRRRVAQLFRWPCMMSELELKHTSSTIVADTSPQLAASDPDVISIPETAAKLPAKRGRPRKQSNYKVDLMNKAKLLKKQASQSNSNNEEGDACALRASSTRTETAIQTRTVKKQIEASASCGRNKANLDVADKKTNPVKKVQVYTNRKRKRDASDDGVKANVAKRVTRSSTRNKSL